MRHLLFLGLALVVSCGTPRSTTIPGCTPEDMIEDGIMLEGVKNTLKEAETLRLEGNNLLTVVEKNATGIPCANSLARAKTAQQGANTKIQEANTQLLNVGACVAGTGKQDLTFKINQLNQRVTHLEGQLADVACLDTPKRSSQK